MDIEKQRAFLSEYEEYILKVLRPANTKIREFFDRWRDYSYWSLESRLSRLPSPSPVQRAVSRIKRPESVVDKILRNPHIFQGGLCLDSVKRMRDAIAGRVIVYFLSNLQMIDKELRNSDLLEVSSAEPPIAYLSQEVLERFNLTHIMRGHKESGYASIHYIVRFRMPVVDAQNNPWFELQVRTLTEDVWGEVEHVLGYKPDKKTSFAVRKQFQIIGAELSAIDEHFNLLYEELTRFQEESIYKDESPLNAENLPAVLSETGIGCAQREIDGLLKLLFSRGIRTVEDLRKLTSKQNMDLVQRVYKSAEDRNPTHFEMVACLAAIIGITREDNKVDAINSQIEFLKAWEKLRKDRT